MWRWMHWLRPLPLPDKGKSDMPHNPKLLILFGLSFATLVVAYFVPAIPQDPAFHDFADKRSWMGISNFGDVVSNLGFLIVGLLGLYRVLGPDRHALFDRPGDVIPYVAIFTAVTLVTVGSGYYHLAPGNAALMWDRLPITLAFMGLFAAVVADRIDRRAGMVLLPVLLISGVGSVVYWHVTELAGQGDLRAYGISQFFPMVAVPLIVYLFRPGRYSDGRSIAWIFTAYVFAKLFEVTDHQIFELTGSLVSGHSLKHVTAAVASYLLLRMVLSGARRPAAAVQAAT